MYKYYFLQDTKVLEAALGDAEVSQKDFLQRLFPSVKATEGEKHCDWLEDFASKANKWIEEQATAAATASKAAIATSEEEDKLQKLEGQVEHYKVVLAETVSYSLSKGSSNEILD